MSQLSPSDQRQLLRLARAALEAAVLGAPLPGPDSAALAAALLDPGRCFVTLIRCGTLRGCVGGLLAAQPLWAEVIYRTAQAALEDGRFPPVTPAELPEIELEISVLTPPQPLAYTNAADLLRQLHPSVDGVTLCLGNRRATFLPQVWHSLPRPEQFLDQLCDKLGVPAGTWRVGRLEVQIYQAQSFTRADLETEPRLDPAVPSSTT